MGVKAFASSKRDGGKECIVDFVGACLPATCALVFAIRAQSAAGGLI
jgi:hypothetical protein